MKSLVRAGLSAVALYCSCSAPAFASTVIHGKCSSIASPNGCLFSGNINGNPNGNANSYISAQNAYNAYNNSLPGSNPDIVLKYLGDTSTAGFPGIYTGAGGTSGIWTLSPGLSAKYVAVKSSSNFIIYQITAANSGTWSTAELVNKQGKQQAMSHLVFFGERGAVPEPATWMMMLMGFGLIGSTLRSRKATLSPA